jgi:hypothetical protein
VSQFLTFEAVDHHVSCLPRDVLDTLALGPHEPDPDDTADGADDRRDAQEARCRVCDALNPLAQRERVGRAALHAKELLDWHEVAAVDLFEFADAAGVDLLDDDEEGPPSAVLRELLGALSYTRCCLIYAFAQHYARVGDR